jgi:hypothetical protein
MILAYASGLRAGALVGVAFLGLLPAQFVVMFVTLRLFALALEPAGDVRTILYGSHVENTLADTADADTTPANTIQTDPGRTEGADQTRALRLRLFELFRDLNQPASFEGYLMQAGVLVLSASCLWFAAEPVLQSVFPGFEATRTGPKGFPVTVYIGNPALTVTNGSDADWTCEADLGNQHLLYTFTVAARATRDVDYVVFAPAGSLSASAVRSAARRGIGLTCVEPSGVSHWAVLE